MHFVLGDWPAIAAPDMLCHISSNVNPFSMLFDFGIYNLNVSAQCFIISCCPSRSHGPMGEVGNMENVKLLSGLSTRKVADSLSNARMHEYYANKKTW